MDNEETDESMGNYPPKLKQKKQEKFIIKQLMKDMKSHHSIHFKDYEPAAEEDDEDEDKDKDKCRKGKSRKRKYNSILKKSPSHLCDSIENEMDSGSEMSTDELSTNSKHTIKRRKTNEKYSQPQRVKKRKSARESCSTCQVSSCAPSVASFCEDEDCNSTPKSECSSTAPTKWVEKRRSNKTRPYQSSTELDNCARATSPVVSKEEVVDKREESCILKSKSMPPAMCDSHVAKSEKECKRFKRKTNALVRKIRWIFKILKRLSRGRRKKRSCRRRSSKFGKCKKRCPSRRKRCPSRKRKCRRKPRKSCPRSCPKRRRKRRKCPVRRMKCSSVNSGTCNSVDQLLSVVNGLSKGSLKKMAKRGHFCGSATSISSNESRAQSDPGSYKTKHTKALARPSVQHSGETPSCSGSDTTTEPKSSAKRKKREVRSLTKNVRDHTDSSMDDFIEEFIGPHRKRRSKKRKQSTRKKS